MCPASYSRIYLCMGFLVLFIRHCSPFDESGCVMEQEIHIVKDRPKKTDHCARFSCQYGPESQEKFSSIWLHL